MPRIPILLAALAAALPAGAQTKLAPDLALVPADAFAVVHVKLADLWKSDALRDARFLYAKAGADAVAAFDKRFVPVLATVDRLTVYQAAGPFVDGTPDPKVVGILQLSEPLDQEKFLKQFAAKPVKKKGKFADFVTDEDGDIAVRFVSPTIVVFGMVEGVQEMCDTRTARADGAQRAMLELASAGKDPVVLGVSLDALPSKDRDQITKLLPDPLRPLAAATAISLSLDVTGDGRLTAVVTYADAKAADAAEKAVDAATLMALDLVKDTRKTLMEKVAGDGKPGKLEDLPEAAACLLGVGVLRHAEDVLTAKPVKRRGDALTLSQPLPPEFKSLIGTGVMAASLTAPAIGKIRVAADKAQSSNNLKQIVLALLNYESANGVFPPAATVDKKGNRLLSWRVAILPYIEQDNLYKQFHLDEPWDSEHNIKFSTMNVKTYMVPRAKYPKPGYTHYRGFVGNGAAWDWVKGFRIVDFTDGTSNTWMVVEGADAVPWAKPDDYEFDPKKELPKLGNFFHGFHVGYTDGSVRFFKKTPKMAKEMITKDGGEVVTDDE